MLPMFQWMSLHSCAHRKHTSDFVSHKKQRKNEIEKKIPGQPLSCQNVPCRLLGERSHQQSYPAANLTIPVILTGHIHWCNNGMTIMFTISHSHTGFEVYSTGKNTYQVLQTQSKNMAEEVLGPCTKLLSKYLCLCPNKNAIPRPDQTNLSLQ